MYDMYPEWGPAHNDPDHPLNGGTNAAGNGSRQVSADLRDKGGERPDDN
jgi:hypothetical protein